MGNTSAKVRIPEPAPEPRSSPWRCSWWWPPWRTWCRSWWTSQDVKHPPVVSEIATSILVVRERPQDGYSTGDVSLVKIQGGGLLRFHRVYRFFCRLLLLLFLIFFFLSSLFCGFFFFNDRFLVSFHLLLYSVVLLGSLNSCLTGHFLDF